MILQTARLTIRKFQPADLPSLIDLFGDAEVMRFIGSRRAMTGEESREWLSNLLQTQDHTLTRFAVALHETDELIGVAGLRQEEDIQDFGYYFRRAFWGQGYAAEACSAILQYLEDHLHLQDYQIFIADENLNSIKMIKSLGFHATHAVTKSGELGHLYQRKV